MEALLAPWQLLYPSQRLGALLLESASWNGKPQEFQLQWHEDRVYFRLNGDDSTTWATLNTCAEADALSCFHNSLASGRYGSCFATYTTISKGKGYFLFYLYFIYSSSGMGLLREWSSLDWIVFAPRETRAWVFFPDLSLIRTDSHGRGDIYCRYAAQSVRDDLLLRRVSDEEIERLSWKSLANKAEFLLVMRWLLDAHILVPKAGAKSWSGVSLTTHTSHIGTKIHWGKTGWRTSQDLKQWLQNYFVGEGFEWRHTDWGKRRFRKLRAREPHLRVFLEPRGIYWRFPFTNCTDPTFHEQLEARHELREWLLTKSPDSPANEWIFPRHQP